MSAALPTTPPAIDSHQHFWRYDPVDYAWIDGPAMLPLRRDFLPADLRPLLDAANIAGTVAVQARQSLAETEWLLTLAAENPWIRGVVGWAPLTAPDIAAALERMARNHPRLRGLRHVLQDERDTYFARPDFNRGIAALAPFGLTYDILIYARQLPAAIALVDRHPGQSFILDHCAKPAIREGALTQWRADLHGMAERENVVCKLSGLVTEADHAHWTPSTLTPYIETVVDAFGPNRLMFGSDWPVCTLATTYSHWHATADALTASLTPTERAALFGETANRVYNLTD